MSEEEPRRLLDDPETSEALRSALEAGRDELPNDHQLASLASRLGPLLGPGGGGGGAAAGGSGAAAKVIGTLAAAAAVGGAVWWGAATSSAPEPRPRAPRDAPNAEAPLPEIAEPEIPEGIDVPAPLEEEPIARPPQRADPRPAFETDPDAELALIRSAQSALRTSPSRALEIAAEHERRFGEGTLTQEREVVAIEALANIGRTDEARARAERFHQRWPRSAYRRRIDVVVPP